MPNPAITHIDARRWAQKRLPRLVFDYIDGAAGQESAALGNTGDLALVKLAPRVLADLQAPDLGATFLGKPYSLPFGIAPMGMCNLAWPGADQVLASLARQMVVPLGVSTAASSPLGQRQTRVGRAAHIHLKPGLPATVFEHALQRA